MTVAPGGRVASARGQQVLVGVLLAVLVLLCGSAPALASVSWRVTSLSNTAVAPGGQLTYHLDFANTGTEPSDGSQVNLTVTLPAGMTGVSATGTDLGCPTVVGATGAFACTGTPTIAPSQLGTRMTITVALDPVTPDLLTTSSISMVVVLPMLRTPPTPSWSPRRCRPLDLMLLTCRRRRAELRTRRRAVIPMS